MSASLQARTSSSQPRSSAASTAATSSLSTITRVWNSRLRASSSLHDLPEMCDVVEVTPSSKREARLRRASFASSISSRLEAASGVEEGLTDSPAATASSVLHLRSSASSVRCSATRVAEGSGSGDRTRSVSLPMRDGRGTSLETQPRVTAVGPSSLAAMAAGASSSARARRFVDPACTDVIEVTEDDEQQEAEPSMARLSKPLFSNTLLTDVPDEGRLLTLVLDLDETLVSNRDSRKSEAVLRPYCLHVLNALRHMKELEIVLWTASTKETASPVVEQLHQTGVIFDDIIYRNNLWFTQPIHTKNLKLLGRDMNRVLIVDNSVGCCKMHPRNSLLVEDFHGVRRRTDAALVNVYYVVDALLRMLREREMSVSEGLRCLMAEGQLCHTVSYDLPDFFKNIPLMEVPELKRPPMGRFVRANTMPPNTSIMQHWVY